MDMDDIRERVALACETCRKRKRKCDGVTPTCSWCAQKNIECQYIAEKPRKRKHDPTYVTGLETQIELLKEEVRRLQSPRQSSDQPKHISDILADDYAGEGLLERTLGEDSGVNLSHPTSSEFSDQAAMNDVSSLMWQLKIGDTGETTLIGPSGNFCFSTSTGESPNQSHLQGGGESYESDGEAYQLSSNTTELSRQIIEAFSIFINPTHQFLDSESIQMLEYESSPEPTFLKSAVLAAGSLYASGAAGKAYGNALASKIDATSLETCRKSPSIETVQALAIMCWRELGLGNENMAWMYNSMACSLSIHLGLSVSSLKELTSATRGGNTGMSLSQVQRQRTRAFWSVLFLDRIATSLLGRHCVIPWKRVQSPHLVEVLGECASNDEIAFDLHCKLWFLHDQCMDRIYSFEFNGLDENKRHRLLMEARDELLSFRTRLKAQFNSHEEDRIPTVTFCHMSYHMSQLLIHRPYLNEPPQSVTCQLAFRTMTVEAATMVKLIRAYEKVGTFDKVPPFVVHSVQTAAITLLLNATSTQSTLRNQSIKRFRVCVDALEAMGTRWPSAIRAITLLRELAARWKTSIALPMRYSGPLRAENAVEPGSEVLTPEPSPANSQSDDSLCPFDNAGLAADLPAFGVSGPVEVDFDLLGLGSLEFPYLNDYHFNG